MSIKLNDAVVVVQKEIRDQRAKYETIVKTEEQNLVLIEGATTTGYYCQLMVDPKDVAKIMLKYDYSVWCVFEEDVPDGMWEDLGRKFGLMTVLSLDL